MLNLGFMVVCHLANDVFFCGVNSIRTILGKIYSHVKINTLAFHTAGVTTVHLKNVGESIQFGPPSF